MGASASLLADTRSAQAVTLPTNALAAPISPDGGAAVFHTVADGESLWQIALAHDVDVQAIRVANGISTDEVIQAGQVLRIPATPLAPEATSSKSVASAPLLASVPAQGQMTDQVSGPVGALAPQSEPPAPTLVANSFSDVDFRAKDGAEVEASTAIQQRGLASGASDLTSEDMAVASTESADGIAGRTATLALSSQPEASANSPVVGETRSDGDTAAVIARNGAPDAAAASPATMPADLPDYGVMSYRVKAGDTLWSIAQRLGVDSQELLTLNQGMDDPDVLSVGSTLLIPAATLPLRNPTPVPVQPAADSSEADGANQDVLAVAPQTSLDPLSKRIQEVTSGSWDREALYERIRAARLATEGGTDQVPAVEEEATIPEGMGGGTLESLGPNQGGAAAVLLAEAPEQTDSPVANLLRDVRELGQQSADNTDDAPVAIAASATTTVAPERQLQTLPAIAPGGPVESPLETPAIAPVNPELLAAAPLDPDAYTQRTELPTGTVVSPGMPVLPDSDQFLPELPNRFDGYTWPAQGVLTSGYGWRWGRMHRGIDIAGPVGTPIYAAGDGTVVSAGWNSGGYGNMVDIRHADGSLTRYAHNSRLLVRSGQHVRQGQQIAEMGSTGYSTGPHLHFEIHPPNSGAVNPMAYLPQR